MHLILQGEETEAQSSEVTKPRSHCWGGGGGGQDSIADKPDSRACAFPSLVLCTFGLSPI